jgi:hypothetical protein
VAFCLILEITFIPPAFSTNSRNQLPSIYNGPIHPKQISLRMVDLESFEAFLILFKRYFNSKAF